MATNHTCDRCSKSIISYSVVGNAILVPFPMAHYDTRKTQKGEGHTKVDLCNECIISLREWCGLETVERVKE